MSRRAVSAVRAATAGEIFELITEGSAVSRPEIARVTGLSRTAVSVRVDQLMDQGLIAESSHGPSTVGRPATHLRFNPGGGTVLAAALGMSRTQLAVCDLAGTVLAESRHNLDLEEGPAAVFGVVVSEFQRLLKKARTPVSSVRGIGVSIPGPVETATGRSIMPPLLPGWDGTEIPPLLTDRFAVPVRVENDVNALAVGERHLRADAQVDDMIFVKVSTGIGAAIISGGRLHRGVLGAAGEIGHTAVRDANGEVCRCGKTDCLEAVASAWAIMRDLARSGRQVDSVLDLAELVQRGDAEVLAMIRTAGRRLGEVLAGAVNLLNPAAVIVGGDLAGARDPLMGGVQEGVYQHAASVATRTLRIESSRMVSRAGLTGCAAVILDDVLSAASVDAAIAGGSGRAASSA